MDVGTMSMSSSAAAIPASARMRSAATIPRSLEAWDGSAKRRSRMPVRARIHSSEVSTRSSSSALVTTRSGT